VKVVIGNDPAGWISSKKFERWIIIEGARVYEEIEEKQIINKDDNHGTKRHK
jgi:hypothetical protein